MDRLFDVNHRATAAAAVDVARQDLAAVAEGEALRDDAIARADEHAKVLWKGEALEALFTVARTRSELTGDDVWTVLEMRQVPGPHEPRALGAIFQAAHRFEWIEPTDRYVQGRRPLDHRGPKRVWRSRIWTGP